MKQSRYVVFALLAGVVFCVGMRPVCAETTWHVDDDGPADFATIQAAIDASSDGDTIIVRDGTYTGDGNRDIDFGGKAVHLRSENGPENCVIDCQGTRSEPHRGFYFHNSEDENSIVDGFTIRNGYAGGSWDARRGGGIYCYQSSPTIINNTITDNTATWEGGGISCRRNSSPTISNNTITDNTADLYGGGIYSSNSSPTITNNTITDNTATGAPRLQGGEGGGICCYYSSPTITNNTIAANTAQYGGGISCFRSSPTIENSILWGNDASQEGPEVYLASQRYPSTLTIRYSNVAGGAGAAYVEEGCTLDWGPGNIDTDPLFADPGRWDDNGTPDDTSDDTWIDGDYHLKSEDGRWGAAADAGEGGLVGTATIGGEGDWVSDDVTSRCINAGDPASNYADEPLFNGGRINMGACGNTSEASQGKWILPGDCNSDSLVDMLDLIFVRDVHREDPASGDNWRGDVNEDGVINILDLLYVRNRLGTRRE